MSNQAIIENLEALLAAVEAQPERLFNLDNFRMERPCGTLFCVAGLAANMPRFQALGMVWDGDPSLNGTSVWDGGGDPLFGPNSMSELFQYAGGGGLDEDLGWDKLTHKQLAIARLKYRIAEYKANEQTTKE